MIEPSAQAWPLAWTCVAALLAAELLAFYAVCSHQVHRAEARHQMARIEAIAFGDCLAYVNGSTIASCGRAMSWDR